MLYCVFDKKRFVCCFFIMNLVLASCSRNHDFIRQDVSIVNQAEPGDTLKCNGFSELCDKRLDEIAILMTHNSFNSKAYKLKFPNQSYSIYRQLTDGVRGLMLDVYPTKKGLMLYHGYSFLGKRPLASVLKEIRKFLKEQPHEVIVIIFEDYCSHQEIIADFRSAGLEEMIYNHQGAWPVLAEMIEQNKRIVLFTEESSEEKTPGLHNAWQYIFDTRYTFSNIASMNCAANRGCQGDQTFYLFNHWITNKLGLGQKSKAAEVNSRKVLSDRLLQSYQEHHRNINFLGVDFYHIGDALQIVDSINGVLR